MSGIAFSVIVPTCNRPQPLAHCLHSLAALDYPADAWELIVVNDGGVGVETAASPQLLNSLPVHIVNAPHRGPAAARNSGAAVARGTFFAFTDDDCRVQPNWLAQFQAALNETGCDALGGRSRNPQPQRVGMQASQFLIDFLYRQQVSAEGQLHTLVSNNMVVRREAFTAVNGFDATFPLAAAEDMEFSLRLVLAGYRLGYAPDAQLWHHHQLTAWGHLRQQFRYGRGGHYFGQRKREGAAIVAESNNSFNRALVAALRHSHLSTRARLLVLLGQVAYRLGLVSESVRRRG